MDKNYDWNTPVEETSKELAKMLLTKVHDNKDWIIRTPTADSKLSPEEIQEINRKFENFSTEVMQLVASLDIPAMWAGKCCELMIAVFNSIQTVIEGNIGDAKKELISRHMGIKSPMTGSYAAEYSTYKDILVKLNEVREATGNDPEDYESTRKKKIEDDVAEVDKK